MTSGPERGNLDIDQVQERVRLGLGGQFATSDGSFTEGNAPKYDADGTLIDSGVAPGGASGAAGGDLSGTYPNPTVAKINGVAVTGTPSSGQVLTATGASAADWEDPSGGGGSGAPWLSITDPSSISFSWRNQGSASVQSRTQSVYLLAPAASGDNIKGREISAPSTPWSITVGLIPHTHNQNFNSCGLYVSDGTKLIASPVGTGGAFGVNKYTNVTTFSGANYAAPGTGFAITPIFVKVVDDGTNLKWYWSPNGIDFHLVTSNARLDYLASVSFVGFYANSNNSSWAAACLLVSWVQGTS